jgi:hypothetical protein
MTTAPWSFPCAPSDTTRNTKKGAQTPPKHDVRAAIATINDPEASGEALRHVLVGGVHSVEDFATEVAEAEGGEPLPAHQATKIIGEVLTELDS